MVHIMKCCICDKMTKVHLLILGKNICSCCEDKILKIKSVDKNYQKYKNGLKKLFVNNL